MEQFVLAFDSNLAPIVGQQITITSANAAAAGPRIDLLVARAAAGECDLVAKGTFAGEQRGAYRLPSGMFRSDQTSDPLTTEATVRTTAGTAGQEVTYTCVPPGSGERIGVDRDGDGFYDHDELDAGSDPADPASVPGGTTTTTSPTTTTTSTTIPAGNGQAIKGSSFVVRAPASGNPAARKFSLAAKEVTSPNGVVGDPIANGATLTVDISGTKPSSETFVLAPGSGWRAVSGGFRYRSTGTVRKLLIKVTAAGLFSIKASGKGQAVLVPPNTGSSVEATPRHRRRRSLLHVVRRSGRWRLRPGHRESLAREESAGRRRVPVIGPPWSVH